MNDATSKNLNILGIRGIPAAHGGFETFAEHFSLHMRDAGWNVTVYCQGNESVKRPQRRSDEWNGVHRVHFDTRSRGVLATMEFDLRCAIDVLRRPGVDLVLGYNTAVFNVLPRLMGRRIVMNMDGIEWKRQKWSRAAKVWFWCNEWIGCRICTVPIADHPEIAAHLASRGCNRAVMIPYGAASIAHAPVEPLDQFDLSPSKFFVSIARIEPENSILEIVEAFGLTKTGCKLIILGLFTPNENSYHAKIAEAAMVDVLFPGPIYDQNIVRSLRRHCLAYLHGHQVGGTNPSLVEALGAESAIIAHDNRFNRWTAGGEQLFFRDAKECAAGMNLLAHAPEKRKALGEMSRRRHAEVFQFDAIHDQYEKVIVDLRPS